MSPSFIIAFPLPLILLSDSSESPLPNECEFFGFCYSTRKNMRHWTTKQTNRSYARSLLVFPLPLIFLSDSSESPLPYECVFFGFCYSTRKTTKMRHGTTKQTNRSHARSLLVSSECREQSINKYIRIQFKHHSVNPKRRPTRKFSRSFSCAIAAFFAFVWYLPSSSYASFEFLLTALPMFACPFPWPIFWMELYKKNRQVHVYN